MYVGLHNHTDHSNYRLLDSMNRVGSLIEYAHKLGHSGIAITDHETVGSHMEALHFLRDKRAENPDKWNNFKLILGNEIYLCNKKAITEDKIYIFPHFILLAKNIRGHKALRELSTRAWCENSFMYAHLRVPTYYEDLIEVMKEYKGDVIASTACIGGALPRNILKEWDKDPDNPNLDSCRLWIDKMINIFGKENFVLELQPSEHEEQKIVNKYLIKLAEEKDLRYIITTDAHYLKKEDIVFQEAFLKSQEDADREVGDFYATTYVMSEEEIHSYMDESIGADAVNIGLQNTFLISEMVEEYSLDKPLNIPYIPEDISEPDPILYNKYKDKISQLEYFYTSEHESNRHLIREILKSIASKPDIFENDKAYEAIDFCLNSIRIASEKQNTQWAGYLLQTKELIKICWDSGSLVGPLRGSAGGFCLLYMLDIIQVNALQETVKMYPWRFLNPERVSPLDIDIDVEGPLRETIVKNLQDKYGGYRHVTKVQTLLKAKAKQAIQIAARGLGYTPEDAVFLGTFIKAERGTPYTLSQTYYGDEEEGILPDKEFVNLMNTKFSRLWEVAQCIEGLIIGTGQHAGGVILCKEDIVENVALMKNKAGEVLTQFDLHTSEDCSLIKWDLLGVDSMCKIHTAINLLLEDGRMKWQGDLRSTYEEYLNVYKIDRTDPKIWDLIDNHQIMSLFQFEKQSGYQAIELGQPRDLEAMSALNSIMRLMAPTPGAEAPLQKYSRFRNNIQLWYDEMDEWGLTKEEQKWLEPYALKNYGFLPNQENFMEIVQDPVIGGYSLLWADMLRKSIAKKNPKAFNELQDEFFKNMKEKNLPENLCNYVWMVLISANKGYGFNTSHTLGYSIVALQEANLAYKFPMIYWNCANLISDSGGEDGNTNYGKISAAIGKIQKAGTVVSLPDINRVRFNFRPDATTNEIVYGLKPIQGVNTKMAKAIIDNQPYASMQDFIDKMQNYKNEDKENKFGDVAMIQLIKAGCFDELENKDRREIMREFIYSICSPLTSLKMANIEDLASLKMLTADQEQYELRLFRFKKYLLSKKFFYKQDGKSPSTAYYEVEPKFALPYFYEHFENSLTLDKDYFIDENNKVVVKRGALERVFDKLTENFKTTVLRDEKMLEAVNNRKFKEIWDDKAQGTISKWEMDSMCFYYHEHELANVNREEYGIVNFDDLPEEPNIADTYYWRGQEKARFKLYRICGTVLDRNKDKHLVTLLTPDGVVTCKFYKGQFSFYDRQIVKVNDDGTKTTLEKSWFSRGTKLLITGFRRDEIFIPKNYSDSLFQHSVQLITSIDENTGDLTLIDERVDPDEI